MLTRLRYALLLALQYGLPHITISRLAGAAARWRFGPWKNLFIRLFAKAYRPDMGEAQIENPSEYPCFSAFFTRKLKVGARVIEGGADVLVSPSDGAVSQLGPIRQGRIFQAKGHDYSVDALLGDTDWAGRFENGQFATIYLAPKDYHRVHMPCSGHLRRSVYVPGRLFSVAPWTAERIPGLFARNERVVGLFETDSRSRFAVVLVGAMIVGSMSTVWSGRVNRRGQLLREDHTGVHLLQGEEMGRFDLGSTVIMLFEDGTTTWESGLESGLTVRMGQKIATVSDS